MIVFLDSLRLEFAHRIARLLAKTRVSPNQVTILRLILSIPSSLYFFSFGDYLHNLIGLAIYVSLVPLDWVDGALARITKQESALGKWLDITFDRVLMLSVLVSIFCAGINSEDAQLWSLLAVFFFSAFFFLTTLLSDFDRMFNLEFSQYAQVEKEALSGGRPLLLDRILVNLLNVHRTSFSKFLFCISYPLFVGIIIDRLLWTFIFLIVTFSLRSLGIMYLMYSAAREGKTKSRLVEVLRGRL